MMKIVFFDQKGRRTTNEWVGFASHEEAQHYTVEYAYAIPRKWTYEITYM